MGPVMQEQGSGSVENGHPNCKVTLLSDGEIRKEIKAGEKIDFQAVIELPKGAGNLFPCDKGGFQQDAGRYLYNDPESGKNESCGEVMSGIQTVCDGLPLTI